MKELFENYKAENGRYPSIRFDYDTHKYYFYKKHVPIPAKGMPKEYIKHIFNDKVFLTDDEFNELQKLYNLRQKDFKIQVIQIFEVQ